MKQKIFSDIFKAAKLISIIYLTFKPFKYIILSNFYMAFTPYQNKIIFITQKVKVHFYSLKFFSVHAASI